MGNRIDNDKEVYGNLNIVYYRNGKKLDEPEYYITEHYPGSKRLRRVHPKSVSAYTGRENIYDGDILEGRHEFVRVEYRNYMFVCVSTDGSFKPLCECEDYERVSFDRDTDMMLRCEPWHGL